MKFRALTLGCLLLVLFSMSGCGSHNSSTAKVRLDPANPTHITVWHYYNGTQQIAFDGLIEEFNQTEGKERGIYVESASQGNVNDLENNVLAAFNSVVGSDNPPDIFSSYADTAYTIEQMGKLVDLDEYMTQDELDTYVDSFVDEGRISADGKLRIFPTAKSSEVFMMSKTDWDEFSTATGASIDELATIEGVARTAEAYYNWTDAKTPDVPNDGKAFYGRDAMANLFIIGSQQLGVQLFKIEDGEVTLQLDRDVMRKIWDSYYVPYIKGYFSAYGRFRSDDVKIGEIIAYTGSTSSTNYFPDTVETEDGTKNIDYMILPAPIFEGGKNYMVQQGAGMVVTKSTPEREYASVVFLEWFTQTDNNLLFSCTSGYMPVKKEAFSKEKLDATIESKGLDVSEKTYNTMISCFDMTKSATFYTDKAFKNGAAARNILEYNLSDKAAADRELVIKRLEAGMSLEEAAKDLAGNDAFEEWYNNFHSTLINAIS